MGKMAEAVEEEIENALNLVISTTEQSSNMKKFLKEEIFETVSTLRQLFVKIKTSGDRKISEIDNLTLMVNKLETELQSCSEKQAEVQQTLSITDNKEQSGWRARLLDAKSIGPTPVPPEEAACRVALPTGKMSSQYATVVKESRPAIYEMTVRSRGAHPSEEIKQLLKLKINPGEIDVGVNALKSHNGES